MQWPRREPKTNMHHIDKVWGVWHVVRRRSWHVECVPKLGYTCCIIIQNKTGLFGAHKHTTYHKIIVECHLHIYIEVP